MQSSLLRVSGGLPVERRAPPAPLLGFHVDARPPTERREHQAPARPVESPVGLVAPIASATASTLAQSCSTPASWMRCQVPSVAAVRPSPRTAQVRFHGHEAATTDCHDDTSTRP